jgi:hypothetical protein
MWRENKEELESQKDEDTPTQRTHEDKRHADTKQRAATRRTHNNITHPPTNRSIPYSTEIEKLVRWLASMSE